MHKLLLSTLVGVGISMAVATTPAEADAIYTLGTSNTSGVGSGPYATVDVSLVNSTTANVTFSRLDSYTFGEMGLNVNATNFTASSPSFTLAPTSNQTPTFTTIVNGSGGQSQMDGFGNFSLVQSSNPNGFSSSLVSASFTLTDLSGNWDSDPSSVLVSTSPEAAVHAFTGTGNSFFAAGNCTSGCGPNPPPPPPPPPPPENVPEPASMFLLGAGLLGVGMVRRWHRRG